jgi:hypothetical protein
MDHSSDGGEGAVKCDVGSEVGRGLEFAFDDFAVEVSDDHVGGSHPVIGDSTRLDDAEALVARDCAGVAERVDHQAAADELQIGFEHFVAEGV